MKNQNIPRIKEDRVDIGFKFTALLGRIQNTNEVDPEYDRELLGVSPREIGVIMVLVTVFLPVGVINPLNDFLSYYIYSGLWFFSNPNEIWYVFNPVLLINKLWISIPLCTFNFLFIRQVDRFFQGKTSRDIALMYGILSVIAPTAISLALVVSFGFFAYITPIPIQFLVGVILLYRFREPEVLGPWSGYFLDWSWWTRLRHSPQDTSGEVIPLTKLLRDHDADWMEEYDG